MFWMIPVNGFQTPIPSMGSDSNGSYLTKPTSHPGLRAGILQRRSHHKVLAFAAVRRIWMTLLSKCHWCQTPVFGACTISWIRFGAGHAIRRLDAVFSHGLYFLPITTHFPMATDPDGQRAISTFVIRTSIGPRDSAPDFVLIHDNPQFFEL